MDNPKIYVFDGFPVKGEMGDLTNLEINVACEKCKRKEIIEHVLSYKFDEWSGEDIVKGANFYLISERLKHSFEENRITGVVYKQIINEKSEYFKIRKSAYQEQLPKFYKIEIENFLDGPEIWWKRAEVCPKCKDQKWEPTEIGIASMITDDPYEEYTPREVYKENWKGEEIFLLNDPGPPIITENMLRMIEKTSNQKIELRNALWV